MEHLAFESKIIIERQQYYSYQIDLDKTPTSSIEWNDGLSYEKMHIWLFYHCTREGVILTIDDELWCGAYVKMLKIL
jgi:hypothetical protein